MIELPLHYQPVSIATAQQQTRQLVHKHPLLNTNQLIRRPDLLAFRDYVAKNSMLETLLDLGRAEPPLTVADADIEALQAQGFRYVVLHNQVPGDSQHLAGERAWADLVSEPARSMLHSIMGDPTIQTPQGQVYDLTQAQIVAGRTRTWTGKNVENLKPPFDTAETGFTLHLGEGDLVELTEDTMRGFSMWSRPAEADHGSLMIRVQGDGIDQNTEVTLGKDTWSYTSVQVDSQAPVRISLMAGEGGARAALTRMQVVR